MPEQPSQPSKGQFAAEAPHKPFTVPPGYVPPTLKEQWLYANRTHPYSRYGYSLALLTGLIAAGWALSRPQAAEISKKPEP